MITYQATKIRLFSDLLSSLIAVLLFSASLYFLYKAATQPAETWHYRLHCHDRDISLYENREKTPGYEIWYDDDSGLYVYTFNHTRYAVNLTDCAVTRTRVDEVGQQSQVFK